ncbi:MAG: sigma-70 family RNA polymerase sigma factor [Synergistaceae bacterium]|nr:sigma-70 family RNA polymerase sigma factor [Synergistaceae bacterium]
MPIVAQEARKLAYGNRFTADDLAQEGIVAAISALESYDPERGSVNGYIRACARNRMISYLRRNGRETPVDDSVIDAGIKGGGCAGPALEREEAIDRREALCALIARLSPFEAGVLDAYLRGGGISGAARITKCERKKVDNALQRIRNKARGLRV